MASPISPWRLKLQRKTISIRAPQNRQYALISDFLDLANLSIQEEAVLATNWIKDRPEDLKLPNLAMATTTGPTVQSFPKNITANVKRAINKCESLGSRKLLILHGNPSAIAKDIPRIWPFFDVISCQICPSILVCYFEARSVEILTSLRPVMNPLLGYSSGKQVQDQFA